MGPLYRDMTSTATPCSSGARVVTESMHPQGRQDLYDKDCWLLY